MLFQQLVIVTEAGGQTESLVFPGTGANWGTLQTLFRHLRSVQDEGEDIAELQAHKF